MVFFDQFLLSHSDHSDAAAFVKLWWQQHIKIVRNREEEGEFSSVKIEAIIFTGSFNYIFLVI